MANVRSTSRSLAITAMILGLAGCHTVPRVDGRSAQSFKTSYAALSSSLTAEDRLKLTLAELIMLAPTGCLKSMKPEDLVSFAPELSKFDLEPCRKQMHGMSYSDIMNRAYP